LGQNSLWNWRWKIILILIKR